MNLCNQALGLVKSATKLERKTPGTSSVTATLAGSVSAPSDRSLNPVVPRNDMPTPAQVEKEQSRDHRTRPSVAIRQPAPGLAESILQGTSANLLGLILTFAQHVLLLPLFLHSWGGRLYGDWLALTAAAGYLSLLEGGFQRYLTNRMNAAWDLGDPKQFHRLLHTGIVFSVAVTGVGAVVVALGAFFIPWPKLLRLSILDQSLSGATLMLAGLSLLASIPAGIVGGVYRCLKEYPRGVSLANLARLLQVLAIAAALWQGKGILTIATLLLLAPLLAMLAGIADIRARHPNVRLRARDASLRLLVKSLRPSLYFLLLPLSHAFWVQGSIIIRLFRVFSGWPTGSRLLHPADPTSPAVTSEPKRRPRNPQIPYTPVRSWATRKGNKTLINRELSL